MTFNEYVTEVVTECPAYQRRGQYAFNALHEMRPQLADRVRGTRLDPFYDDTILGDFFAWVADNWDAAWTAEN